MGLLLLNFRNDFWMVSIALHLLADLQLAGIDEVVHGLEAVFSSTCSKGCLRLQPGLSPKNEVQVSDTTSCFVLLIINFIHFPEKVEVAGAGGESLLTLGKLPVFSL